MTKIKGVLLFCLFWSIALTVPASHPVNAASLIVSKTAGSGVNYACSDYADDSACVQAALDGANSGDTVFVKNGDYNITRQITQSGKDFSLEGEGAATFHLNVGIGTYGFNFRGTDLGAKTLSQDASKGSAQIVLSSAAGMRANDLVRIWKDVLWCPTEYPEHKTGETYLVKSVSGNTVTLNQPLLRDYKISETVSARAYRPSEVHVRKIRVENVDAMGAYLGLELKYCINSSLTDSWFNNNGQAAFMAYTSFNVDIKNNEVYNGTHDGNGYGIGVANASVFVNIENNHIENCRHTIMSGSSEPNGLNRDVYIANNTLIGTDAVDGAYVLDSHQQTINYTVVKNKLYAKPGFAGFSDGTQMSIFSENEVYGAANAVRRRGTVTGGFHVVKDNYLEGAVYGSVGEGDGDTLVILDNTQGKGDYGIVYLNPEKYDNVLIKGNRFYDIRYEGINWKTPKDGMDVKILDNTFEKMGKSGIYIDGGSYSSGSITIQNNVIRDADRNRGESYNAINLVNAKNTAICSNQISDSTGYTPYGIYEGAGSDYTSHWSNAFSGIRTGNILLTGANSGENSAVCGVSADLPRYLLSVVGGSGFGVYAPGATVSVSALTPVPGKVFSGWSGDTQYLADSGSPVTTLTMPKAYPIVRAVYGDAAPAPVTNYSLTVSSGSGSGSYAQGQTITMIANAPATGKVFDKWTGDTAYIASATSATTTVTMPAKAIALTATYVSSVPSGNGSFDNGYSYRRLITVNHAKVPDSNQSDFPLLISLTDASLKTAASGGKVQNGSGYDIVFTAGDGSTELDHEIESYDGLTGTVRIWVKVPTLSYASDTRIYMYYGKSGVTASQEDKYGVWDEGGANNFEAVYHLNQDPSGASPQMFDSVANAYNGTSNGTMTSGDSVPGQIGAGLDLDGLDDYVIMPTMSKYSPFTISMWINGSLTQTKGGILMNGGSTANRWGLSLENGNINSRISNGTTSDIWSVEAYSSANYPSGWHKITVTDDGTNRRYYRDGVFISQHADTVTNSGVAAALRIGKGGGTDLSFFTGKIDEVTVSSVARSAGWVQTEYNNQSDPSAFYSISSEELPGQTSVTYSLTVANGSGDGSYASGAKLTITASAPATGKVFDKWTGDTAHIASATSATTTVTMPAKAITLTSTYKDASAPSDPSGGTGGGSIPDTSKYTLTVNQGSGDGSYPSGNLVTISADAAPSGKTFDRWTGDAAYLASAIVSTTVVTMPAKAITLTATYKDAGGTAASVKYTLTVNSGTDSGSYEAGAKVAIHANLPASSGQVFDRWTGDTKYLNSAVSSAAIVTMPAKAITLTATYKDSGIINLPDGTLIKQPDSPKVYVIVGGEKKWIGTPEQFEQMGYKWTSIQIVAKETLDIIDDFEDNLIRLINDYKVYLVTGGVRRHIPNPQVFLDYGFLWEDVKNVDEITVNRYKSAYLVKESGKEAVYYLNGSGVRKHIPTAEIFNSYNDKWEDIQIVSRTEMESYPLSDLIQLQDSNQVYLVSGSIKKLIPDVATFARKGYDWNRIITVNKQEFDWYQDGGTVK